MAEELLQLFLEEGFASFSLDEVARRLRCSKTTLYLVAPSKEQIVVAVVRAFFQRSAARIEARMAASGDARERLSTYLLAVADELQPASPTFYADIAAFAPANELYEQNTLFAVRRVQELVSEGVEQGVLRQVDASFVGAAVARVMTGIQAGDIAQATGLNDAEAYGQLADLVMAAVSRPEHATP